MIENDNDENINDNNDNAWKIMRTVLIMNFQDEDIITNKIRMIISSIFYFLEIRCDYKADEDEFDNLMMATIMKLIMMIMMMMSGAERVGLCRLVVSGYGHMCH